MYKYFTWIDKSGYHKGQDLLSRQQIATLLTHMSKPVEAYATIQDYDKEANIIGCPIYFDIDSLSLEEAYFNMCSLVDDLAMDFEVTPAVWFSGSKGFHIVLPLYIRHPRCHEIMAMIASEYKQEYDPSVYRTRSMWRCDGTWNSKGKSFKIRTNDMETFGAMVARSKEGRRLDNMPEFNVRDIDLSTYIPLLPDRSKQVKVLVETGEDMMPCLQKLWNMDVPPDGQAHQLCHMMSRWCFKSGLSSDEAVSLFNGHPFWKNVNERDYGKVIDSVYKTGKAFIGCRTGRDAELLIPHCELVCAFNKDFRISKVFAKEKR